MQPDNFGADLAGMQPFRHCFNYAWIVVLVIDNFGDGLGVPKRFDMLYRYARHEEVVIEDARANTSRINADIKDIPKDIQVLIRGGSENGRQSNVWPEARWIWSRPRAFRLRRRLALGRTLQTERPVPALSNPGQGPQNLQVQI